MRRLCAELGLRNVVEAGVLSRRPVYHGLQRRHAALAGRIGLALAAMRDSGELGALEARAVAEATQPRLAPEQR
jgi:hypothetical protein